MFFIENTLKEKIILLYTKLRQKKPIIHCITNYVAMNYVANILLSVGASPAMIHTYEEAGDFVEKANALTINIGTLSPHWVLGMNHAITKACNYNIPWILDPVAHFATPYRRQTIKKLLLLKPSVIRGNASEIIGLDNKNYQGKGIDTIDYVNDAHEIAIQNAQNYNCIIAVTGKSDFVTDGIKKVRIKGGSSLMTYITAMGCALTALIGAFIAISPEEPFEATIAALSTFAISGKKVSQKIDGPGLFMIHFLDELYCLKKEDFKQNNYIEIL